MSRVAGFVCAVAFASGLAGVIALAPSPKSGPPTPKVGPDQPLARANFRYQGRLDADGTMPQNAYLRAAEARKAVAARGSKGPVTWTYLGPRNFGGRIRAILIHPTNANIMWIGSCGGGIWKTFDGGTTWMPQDDFLPGMSVSCMVLDPTNPNILYAGTGEGFFETEEGSTNTACIRGAGIFKSADGGTTWTQLPSTASPDFYFVNRLAVSPADANVLLASTSTGVYRTTNAGATWTRTLAGEWGYDVKFHPTDGARAIAGVHDNGVFYSTNGGQSWTRSTSITAHRTELAYARSNPLIVYAAVANGGNIRIWRSADGGVTFTQQAAGQIGNYEAYNVALWVDPTNPASILYGGVYLYRSTNSGASATQAFTNVHPDMHVFANHPGYNGTTNRTIFIGSDGGLDRLPDANGTQSVFYNGIGITQFYGTAINPVSGRVMGGTQDNYTLLYSGNPNNWTVTAGGDGGYNQTDPADQNFFYGCVYWAYQFRSTNAGVNSGYIYGGANPISDAGNSLNSNFINPFTLDPNNSNRMLVGTLRLWRANNVKATQPSWFVIKPSIAPQGKDNAHFAGNNPYNISAVAIAKGNSDVVWVGHNNGNIYRTTNGTAAVPNWVRVDSASMPDRWVSKLAVDPLDPNHAYASFLGWHDDSVWETTNGGASWTDIASGKLIPASVNVIALHPTIPGWLFAGTDLGLFTSTNNGASWTATTQGPNAVGVEDIAFKDASTLTLATYGRGMWQGTIASSGVPSITSLSPATGTVGAPGMTLTVNGTNFSAASVVKWAGANRTTTYVSDTKLTAQISAADLAFAQVVSVQVVTPPPGGGSSNVVNYSIVNPAPVLTSLTPATKVAGGQSFTLTLNGSNFVGTSKVLWNGSQRNSIFIDSNTLTATITAADIASPGTFPVIVRNPSPGGGDSSPKTVTVQPLKPDRVVVSPKNVTGGASSSGAVYLNGPAPVGGLTITLTKIGDSLSVPATCVAPAGKFSGLFTVTTVPVVADEACTVLAGANGTTVSTPLTVLAPRPNLVTLDPSSVTAGQSSQGTFTLTGVAPPQGITVTLKSGVPSIVQVPATVFVPGGQSGGTFMVTTRPYPQPANVAVWAIYQGKGAYAILQISP